MNRTEHNPEALLDAVISGITAEPIEPTAAEQARQRVWARIEAEAAREETAESRSPRVDHIRSCADFQALMPEYRAGKEKALNMLVGQVMKRTRGKANPELVKQLLFEALA